MFIKKIEPDFCKIEIVIEPGIVPDFDESGKNNKFLWVSYSESKKYNKLIDQYKMSCDLIYFQISIDQQEIYAGCPNASKTIIDKSILIDHEDPKNYQLTFQSSGFIDQHMPLINETTSVRFAIRLASLKIENVDVTSIFDYQSVFFNNTHLLKGGLIFDSNITATLNITTPIYRWLILNQQTITNNHLWDNV